MSFVAALALAAAAALPAGEPPAVARLFANYQALGTFQADFKQAKVLTAEGLTLDSAGSLRVSLPRGALLWEVKTPAHLAVFLDAKILEIHSGTGATAVKTVYDLKTSAFSEKLASSMRELTALLAMNREALSQSYDVTAAADGLMLVPKAPTADRHFKTVHMSLSPQNWIDKIAIEEVSGDRMLLTFAPPKATGTDWIDGFSKGP